MDNRAANSPARTRETRSRRQRRQDTMRRHQAGSTPFSAPTSASVDSMPAPPLPIPPRARVFGTLPSQANLHRHRLRRQRDGQSFGTVQEAVDDLENNPTAAQASSTALNQAITTSATQEQLLAILDGLTSYERRNKRRKLDSDALDAIPKISYGYHGQVEPGRLNMMISYCDGGIFEDNPQYLEKNLLRNDKSVYSSSEDKVNLMLAHPGERPFTCTKIVIKTPVGFPSPVQEGMVFVFMGGNNLLDTTSRFQIKNTHMCPAGRTPPAESINQRSRWHLDNGRWQSDSAEARREVLPLIAEPLELDFDAFLNASTHSEGASPPDDLPPLTRMPLLPPLHIISAYDEYITTSCDPPSDDEEEEDTSGTPVPNIRHRRLPEPETDSDDEDHDPRYPSYSNAQRRRQYLRPIEWTDRSPSSSADDPKPPGKDVPYKRFYIDKKKHVVSIKFDPPVSGRYILFKFWALQGRENVDLQSISVYGFAGPRFFPALVTR